MTELRPKKYPSMESCASRAVIPFDRFSAMIDYWNHRSPAERKSLAAECVTKGHKYRETPYSDDTCRQYVCVRCMNYVSEDAA